MTLLAGVPVKIMQQKFSFLVFQLFFMIVYKLLEVQGETYMPELNNRDVLSQQFLGSGHFRVAKKIYPRVGSGQHTTWVSQNCLLRIRAMATNYTNELTTD